MSKGKTSCISFASWINAERRWATTGTPTPENKAQSGLANLLHLTEYLQHDFFSHRRGGDVAWSVLVARAWNKGYLSAFYRLRSLFSLLMVRHTKEDVIELPKPTRSTVRLQMSPEEVSAYNTLVCAVQSNLLITSMKGAKTSGKQDSLLHRSQTQHARDAFNNIRLVCVGGTQVLPTLTDKNWQESIVDFDACNNDQTARKSFRDFLSRTVRGELSQCECCQVMLATLLVCPCGHLVCTECMDSETDSCVVCDTRFDVDQFQRIQPGFEYKWLHNIEEEERAATGSMDVVNVIGNANVDAQNNVNGGRPQRRPGDGHICQFNPERKDGQCILCLREHEECYLVKNEKCPTCFRTAEECPSYESKNHYLTQQLLKLYTLQDAAKVSFQKVAVPKEYEGMGTERPLKAIIFSQFRQKLNVIGDRLIRRFGPGCVAEYWGMFRRQELHKFATDPNCFILLLSRDGSEGLDLSFVTHIWFVESLWDRSLQAQVEGRAWRMGAGASVSVEILVAESTVEEIMESIEKSDFQEKVGTTAIGDSGTDNQARLRFFLKNLKLITNSATLGSVAGEKQNNNPNNDAEEEPARKKQKRNTEATVRFQEEFQVDIDDLN
jgi:SNF2 family DNA or RNA helicase